MQTTQKILNNKINTLFVHAPGSTSASVQAWFKAGSALENKGEEGIAHFLEHMFFKGTPTRKGNALAMEVENFGGELNAFTSFDYTCYYINTPSTKLKKSTEILLDMISNPRFLQEDIVPEKEVVYEEYLRAQDNPSQFAFTRMQKKFFQGKYSHSIVGTSKSIKNFSREQLIDFRKRYYNSSNLFLVISGDLTNTKSLINTIEKFKLPTGKASQVPEFVMSPRPKIDIHSKDTGMCHLTLAIQAPGYHNEETAAEDLAINCLGHGETSRLHKGLVLNNALANYAQASTIFMTNGGAHFIKASFPEKNMSKVLTQMKKLLSSGTKDGFKRDEVQKIQNQYIASKIYSRESLESFAFTLGNSYVQTGEIHAEDEFIKRIEQTSLYEVNEALPEIFNRPIHISLQVPKKANIEKAQSKIKAFQKDLKDEISKAVKKAVPRNIVRSKYDPQVELIEIKKGIKLLYRHNPMTPTFAAHIYIKGGLTTETLENNGSHSLLSGLITKGHSQATHEEIRLYFEDHSASLSGFAGKNAYGVTMHGLSADTNQLFSHLLNSFTTPTIPEDQFNHDKEMVFRSLEAQKEDPVKHCFEAFNKLVFNEHPYSLSMLGTEESVTSITPDDLRKLHEKNLAKNEILITYCGNLPKSEIVDILIPHTDKLPARKQLKLKKKAIKPISGKTISIPFNREQTHIMMGIPAKPLGSDDGIYLKMLTAHLSGQSSELFTEVRDRLGLCYAVQPINFIAMEGGYWGIYMASSTAKAELAVASIRNIINKIKEKGISKKEFGRIKTMIEGQNLINVQTNDDYANIYSVPALQGLGIEYFHTNAERINQITYSDFQENIKRILNAKANIITVGAED